MPTEQIVEVQHSWITAAPAALIWDIVSKQDAAEVWHPRIAKSMTGRDAHDRIYRDLTFHAAGDGRPATVLRETELFHSPSIMTICYMVEQDMLPFGDYLAELSVTPVDHHHSRIGWRCRLNMAVIDQRGANSQYIISDFYTEGLAALARLAEQEAEASLEATA